MLPRPMRAELWLSHGAACLIAGFVSAPAGAEIWLQCSTFMPGKGKTKQVSSKGNGIYWRINRNNISPRLHTNYIFVEASSLTSLPVNKQNVLTQVFVGKWTSNEFRRRGNQLGEQRNYWFSSFANSLLSALMGSLLRAGLGFSVNWVHRASSRTTQTSECSSSIKNYCLWNNCSSPKANIMLYITDQAIGEIGRPEDVRV